MLACRWKDWSMASSDRLQRAGLRILKISEKGWVMTTAGPPMVSGQMVDLLQYVDSITVMCQRVRRETADKLMIVTRFTDNAVNTDRRIPF